MIDSHCHLDFEEFDGWRDEAVKNALSAGVHTIVNIGTDLQTSINSVELAKNYDCLYATVGVHPHDAGKYNDKMESELYSLLDNEKVVAVGEIGLDFYRDLSPRDKQRETFRRQLEMAAGKKLPVVIHTRKSFREAVEIVAKYAHRLAGGVFHCFPGSLKDAFEVIDMGFHISVGGVITFPDARMAEVARQAPLESVFLETDSPYLTPIPFRGKTNQPAYVKYVCARLAELRKISVEEVETATDRNCRKMFRLTETFEG
jgi:TatD DNase family protein